MSVKSNASKIDFKKKTPVATVKKKPAHQMHFITDVNGEILDVNDAFAVSLGIPPLDLKGRALLDTVFFKNLDDVMNDRAVFNSLSQGGGSTISSLKSGEHILLVGDKHTPHKFFFDWIKGQDNQKYLVACSSFDKEVDITVDTQPDWVSLLNGLSPSNSDVEQVKEIKSDIARDEEIIDHRLTLGTSDVQAFSAMNRDVMCVLSEDGHILRFNTGFTERLEQDLGASFLDRVYDEDRASVRQYLQSFQMHDVENDVGYHPVEFETRMNAKQGQNIWMHWRIHKKGDELYCLGHDITSVKVSEKALRRREQELSEAQALAHMGHWRWNVGSTNIEWSEQIYKIFGVNADEFTPTLDNANALLHKRDIGRMTQAFQRAIIEQNEYDLDFRVVREDKSICYVRCEGRCDLDEDGDVIALYGVMQDVTEQAEHEMELRAAKDAAEQAYASKSRFLANMSHELRTPLNAIIGFSDMIKRQMLGAVGNDKYLDYATSIHDSGEHLLALITDILDMSKIEAGKYELDLETIKLGNIVNTAVRMIESRAQEGVITLDSQIKNDTPNIIADRRAVMQILLNILSNAVKFTEPGGTISVAIEEFDNHVTVKVIDNGVGIPANKLSAVLKPFEQVSSAHTRNHEGSGLGLTITKELAELHGGTIILESAEGEGTTALIRLPRDASEK